MTTQKTMNTKSNKTEKAANEAVKDQAKAPEKAANEAVKAPVNIWSESEAKVSAEIQDILATDATFVESIAKIMKLCADNIDESQIPLELCTNGELDRRLSGVYSKKVPAKKTRDAALESYKILIATDDATLASLTVAARAADTAADAYDKLLVEEEHIKSFKTTIRGKSSIVSSEDADMSKMDQLELSKLIRNFQSRKSTAKKAAEDAKASGKMDEMVKQLGLVDYWQSKVEEAQKHKETAPDKSKQQVKQITDVIAGLEAAPQTEETIAMIAKLKALV